jgi:hypothetical protein
LGDPNYISNEIISELSERQPSPLIDPPRTELSLEGIPQNLKSVVNSFLTSDVFSAASSYQEQVALLVEHFKNDTHRLTWTQIGSIFFVSKATVCEIHSRNIGGRRNHGRPSVLTPAIYQSLDNYIHQMYIAREVPNYTVILKWIEKNFSISLYPSTLRKILSQIPTVKTIKGIPLEATRFDFDVMAVQTFYEQLADDINGTPANMVINCDETGFHDWVDAYAAQMIVPSFHEGDTIEFPVDRAARRTTFLAAIAASGTTLKPLIIVQRKSVEKELLDLGYTPDVCSLFYQENGFIDTAIFQYWLINILIPYIEAERERLQYFGSAYLIMDGCSCHLCDDTLDILFDADIELEILPAHTSDQFQPLDLGIFAIQKQAMGRVAPPKWCNAQTAKLLKILGSFRSVTTPPNIISAFQQAGIVSTWNSTDQVLVSTVDPSLIRKSRCEIKQTSSHADRITINTEN